MDYAAEDRKILVNDMKILVNDMQEARFRMIECQYKLANMMVNEPFVLELIEAEIVKPCIPNTILRNVCNRRPIN